MNEPTLRQKDQKYKCLLCRKEFYSHVPEEDAIYMWNVLQYRPNNGKTVLRCPHCFSMYCIHEKVYHLERLDDTLKLFEYIRKHVLDKEKGYNEDLYDKMKMWFTGIKRCSKCKKLKARETDFTYLHKSSDHLSHICKECANKCKHNEKIDKILKEYEEKHKEK